MADAKLLTTEDRIFATEGIVLYFNTVLEITAKYNEGRHNLLKASEAKTLQIILNPVYFTNTCFYYRPPLYKTTYPIKQFLPITPFSGSGAYLIAVIGLPKIQETDTGKLLVFAFTFALDFIGTPREGLDSLLVAFHNTSQSPVNMWLWNFGDGQTSTSKHPTHLYKPGVYTVSLTSGSPTFGYYTVTKVAYIKVGILTPGDIRLYYNALIGFGDITIENREANRDPGFSTAIILSLFTDKRASLIDTLPDKSNYSGGWWADNNLGSKLWLLRRSKKVSSLLEEIKTHAEASLQWMIEEGIAEEIKVNLSIYNFETYIIYIRIMKDNNIYNYKYYYNWTKQLYTEIK